MPTARDPSGLSTFVETRKSPRKIVAVPPATALTWSTGSKLPLISVVPKYSLSPLRDGRHIWRGSIEQLVVDREVVLGAPVHFVFGDLHRRPDRHGDGRGDAEDSDQRQTRYDAEARHEFAHARLDRLCFGRSRPSRRRG